MLEIAQPAVDDAARAARCTSSEVGFLDEQCPLAGSRTLARYGHASYPAAHDNNVEVLAIQRRTRGYAATHISLDAGTGRGERLNVHFRGEGGEDRVALLDVGEGLHAACGQRFLRSIVLVNADQTPKLLQVADEPLLGVITSGTGGDQELPVARFQQHQLTADLFHEAIGKRIAPPQSSLDDLLNLDL